MNLQKTGNLIKETRKEQNLTQQELADKLYISVKTISKWEQGRGFPSPNYLLPLSKVLGLSCNEIILGEKIKEEEKEKINNELTIKNIKALKRKQMRELYLGILLCLCFCSLEVLLFLSGVDEKIGTLIFILVFLMLFIMEYAVRKQ